MKFVVALIVSLSLSFISPALAKSCSDENKRFLTACHARYPNDVRGICMARAGNALSQCMQSGCWSTSKSSKSCNIKKL